MTVSILGILHHTDATEYRAPGKTFDPEFLRKAAGVYEAYGFDRVLIGQNARSPDPLSIAGYVAPLTRRLKFMVAHRPGFIAPTMAARMFATLDRLSRGRCAAHIITGGSDVETHCDGDFLTKDERYARSAEYVGILRKIWESNTPVDHDGAFYSFRQGFSDVRPSPQAPIPIFWGGASEKGVATGAQYADVYAMGGRSVAQAAQLIGQVRAAAAASGRQPEFCMSMRIIMAATEAEAWRRAAQIREQIVTFRAAGGVVGRDKGETSLRALLEAANRQDPTVPRRADAADRLLWDGLTVAVQGRTHIKALVGTAAQLTEALLQYCAAGIRQFILTGFEPIDDSIAIGRDLIPLVKSAAADGVTLRRP